MRERKALEVVRQRLATRQHGPIMRTQPLSRVVEYDAFDAATGKALTDLERLLGVQTLGELLDRAGLDAWLVERLGPAGYNRFAMALIDYISRPREIAVASGEATTDDPDVDSSELKPQMSRAALRSWTRASGVTAWLSVSARVLDAQLGYSRFRSYLFTLEEVICARAMSEPDRVPLEAQQAAIKLLATQAKTAALALADEVESAALRKTPADERLVAEFTRLSALREKLRATETPRPRDAYQGATLVFQEDPPSFEYRERVFAWCGGGVPNPVVTIDVGDDERPAEVSCSCARPRSGGCSVKLGAVDAVLDVMTVSKDARLREQVIAGLSVPTWLRTLDALASAAEFDEGTEPLLGEDEHLGWLVRDKHGHLDAVPMAIRAAKRKAGWTGKRLAWNRIHMAEPHDLEAADAVVVQLIHDQGTANTNHHYDSLARDVAVLDRLVGHPRVFRRDGGLKRIEVKRTTARLSLDSTEDGNIKIEAKLGDLPLDFADLKRYVLDTSASGRAAWWTPEHDVLVVRIPEALPRLVRALKGRRTELPASAREALIERLPSLATKVDLAVAEDLRGWALEATDRPVCRLTLHGDDDASVLMVALAVRPVEGGQLYPPGDGPELIFGSRDGATVHAKRDLRAEVRAAEALVDTLGLGSALPIGPYTWRYQGADDALRLVSDLQSKPELIEVQWADERPRKVSRTATSSDLRINLTERGAWFKVDGKLTVDGVTVPLGTLLEAVRAKKRFVSVDASTWVRIGQTLADQLAGIAGVTYGSKKALQVSRAASPILAELDASEVPVDTPPTWVTMLANLRQSEIVAPPLPANFKGVLRDYQRVGFEWLSRLSLWSPGACLADDMGLGKTIQGLALLLQRSDAGPQLVVAPTSVGFNWVREAERFAPSLRIKTLRGKADMGDVEHAAPGDLYVTSYEVVQRHDAVFSEVHWQTMVLDEAQAIKNPTTKRAQAIRSLDRAFTLALTGTPIENRTGELWSLFEALTPGLLGTKTQFRARYAIPIEKHGEAEARAELSRLVRPFILRRMKSEVAQELPPRTDIQHDVVLSDGEQKLYDQVRNAAIRSLEKKPKTGSVDGKGHPQQKRFQVLAALTRLRQLACHPRLFDPDSTEPSSKLRALRELVSELRAEGHRALIFSQFTSHLALVREALTEDGATMCYLDGSTPTAERRRQVDRFQAGDADVFLLSVKAGGTGLNLTAANYVIHIDPWWNPAVEDQATDRAHRIGQEQPVTVIRLVTSQTIEANILALHDRKRRLVAELLDGTGDAGVLSTDELFTLISDFA